MKLAMAVLVGLVGSAGIAFMAQHMDHTFKRPEDIETLLQVPALVAIPRLKSRQLAASASSGEGRTKRLKGSFSFHEGRRYYSILRDRVLTLMQGADGSEQPLVVGITSSHYGEGVSSVAANLALAFAENRHYDRVLLVNANKGQPSAHQVFGINEAPGAAEILMDAQGQLIIVEQNLYKVPVDETEDTPPTGGPVARYRYNLLRLVKDRSYRYVVFDLPPLCEGGALPLVQMMDGVVMVVKAEGVRGEIVMRMKGLLIEMNARVLGAVLNKRRYYIPGWLYNRL
jgi:Mrp family chromosome partitioning ATPase